MKNRVHIEAIKAKVNNLFSEWVTIEDEKDGKKNVYKIVDTRDERELSRHRANKLSYYLKEHLDNTEQLFIENEIDKAKELQTYFPDYKTKAKDKEFYFTLQRWIDCLATPKKEIDTRFWLTSFFDETVQDTNDYKYHKLLIKRNGHSGLNIDGKTSKIYTTELAVLLISQELPARNMETQTETTIDGWEYLQTYIEAYKEGEQYFESEFRVSPSTLYGANAEQYVRDIHFNFFHVNLKEGNKGWGYVKKEYPITLTHETIKKFGYYSGIVSKIEEQVKKHRKLFATFDKCDHESTPTPKQGKQEQPNTFDELFFTPEHAEICLEVLRELQPPVIDSINNYVGKAKGVFPLWISVLKSHKPEPLIRHFPDVVYKNLLNDKVKGLNLTEDASEFRKTYKRLETNNVRLDIKALLSQYSQEGKLRK